MKDIRFLCKIYCGDSDSYFEPHLEEIIAHFVKLRNLYQTVGEEDKQ